VNAKSFPLAGLVRERSSSERAISELQCSSWVHIVLWVSRYAIRSLKCQASFPNPQWRRCKRGVSLADFLVCHDSDSVKLLLSGAGSLCLHIMGYRCPRIAARQSSLKTEMIRSIHSDWRPSALFPGPIYPLQDISREEFVAHKITNVNPLWLSLSSRKWRLKGKGPISQVRARNQRISGEQFLILWYLYNWPAFLETSTTSSKEINLEGGRLDQGIRQKVSARRGWSWSFPSSRNFLEQQSSGTDIPLYANKESLLWTGAARQNPNRDRQGNQRMKYCICIGVSEDRQRNPGIWETELHICWLTE
jgi:hypothetical protein